MSFVSTLPRLGREAARIVLCSPCVVCGGELPWLNRRGSCCAACWERLPRIRAGKCLRCALPWEGSEPNGDFVCIYCSERSLPLEWIDAWGRYSGGLDELLQALKFARHHFLALPLAGLLEETLNARGDLNFDAVVPVPMHRAKRRARGFNQAELLSEELSRLVRLRHQPNLLRKKREREAQASLPKEARAENVRGCFEATAVAAGKSILLVDDVCTTGATLRACADALISRGAQRVCALVVARA